MIGVAVTFVLTGPAIAQDLRGPSEAPPPSYTGQSYVDSRGCVFLRAGPPGQESWLPRVDDAGTPVCQKTVVQQKPAPAVSKPAVAKGAVPKMADPAPTGTSALFVQLGSFSHPENATALGQRLTTAGIPVQSQVLASGVTVVLAGPFMDQQAALAVLADMRAEFPDAFIR